MPIGLFGSDGYGTDPYGSLPPPFAVTGAETLSTQIVAVSFSDTLDAFTFGLTNPASYVIRELISGNPLPVIAVTQNDPRTVFLKVSSFAFVEYRVTVIGDVRSVEGAQIDPNANSAIFTGIPPEELFQGVAISSTRVRLLFLFSLLNSPALSDPSSYTLTDLVGDILPIDSVIVEPSLTAVTLVLSAVPMSTTEWYVVTLGPGVTTAGGLTILPNTSKFQYVQPALSISFQIANFTGEAKGGLFGNPLGLVFFSPALSTSVPNSIIQVDEVDVCTRAFDTYTFPALLDPDALFTWSPAGPSGNLGPPLGRGVGVVLWAPFPRLSEAKFTLSFSGPFMVDTVPIPVDSRALATMQEPWAHDHVALLNNPAWKLFDNTSALVPPVFICANNLLPIPPGPMSTITLEP